MEFSKYTAHWHNKNMNPKGLSCGFKEIISLWDIETRWLCMILKIS